MAINALQSSSSAMSALSTSLDVIANNLANVNTQGFKASRANFQDLLYIEKAQPGVENANGDQRPTGLFVGLGVKVSGTQLDFEQGAPIPTERELDLLIDGPGFFRVIIEDERGEGGVAFTRAGNFTLNSDGQIVLANDQGRVLDPEITVPDDAVGVQVLQTGEVFAQFAGSATPDQIGTIELSSFVNPAGLRQLGENLFTESEASGPPIVGDPGDEGLGVILQGFLENSNVDPTLELVQLIKTQRAFEMNSQSIRTADEVLQTVTQLRR